MNITAGKKNFLKIIWNKKSMKNVGWEQEIILREKRVKNYY